MARTAHAVFDPDRIRTDPRPAMHDESIFEFYDRCANPVIGSIRDLLEDWFAEYVAGNDRTDLLGRLRSPSRQAWHAACWELYVHAALRRFGFDVTPHPEVPGSSTRPDFKAISSTTSLFVECVTYGLPANVVSRSNGLAKLYSALDRSGITDYWLAVEIESFGEAPVHYGKFVRAFTRWLTAQEPSAFNVDRGRNSPEFEWAEGGWIIQVQPIARGPGSKGRTDLRPLAVMPGQPDRRNAWRGMRDLIGQKSAKYGRLDSPYVVALNAPEAWPDDRDAEWAVLGPHPFTEVWERQGFLLGQPRELVSGVLMGTAIQPHTVVVRTPILYENPSALFGIPTSVGWPRVRVTADGPAAHAGIDPSDLFGLPRDWPSRPWD